MIPRGIINSDHVLTTLSKIDHDGIPNINQSRGVELWHDGKVYPPKYVISLAFEVATGRVLPASNFITTEAERELRMLGFTVMRAPEMRLGGSDAKPLAVDALIRSRLEDFESTSARSSVEPSNAPVAAQDTVYLVSCVKTKRAHPAPARELFVSPWFVGARELVERSGSPWFVLSTRYGLASPDEILSPYDYTLNTMGVRERHAWASRVKSQMQERLPAAKRVVVFAGLRYHEFLIDYLRGTGALVETPLAGLTRGQQLAWLAERRSGKPAQAFGRREEFFPRPAGAASGLTVNLEYRQNAPQRGDAPPSRIDCQLRASVNTLEVNQEVRKLVQETIDFFEGNPEASIRSGRAALIAIVRKMGAFGTLDQAITDLEGKRKISQVTAIQMRTIQKIRNKVEYEAAKVTSDDAQTCAVALVAVLKAISRDSADQT